MSASTLLATDRILIVDDNVDAASSLGILLRLRGATVDVVHDGPAALDRMANFQPDFVLLDLGMPGMDGFEVAGRIRLQPEYKDVVLVAQTGWGTHEFRLRSRDAGIDHHLVKPVDLESLVQLISRTLHGNGLPPTTRVEGADGLTPSDSTR